ncbi:hypothetical protein ACVIU7_004986 [Bradyrhizobium liaoningense]|nr:hypothetical protein GCM10007858_48800 [Bradyrhizobium liaoningense]
MSEFSIIALDLAKNVFQMHGADASGTVLFRKKLRRDQILKCLAAQPTCTVATRLCGMAGACPAAALHRRQAEARQDVTYLRGSLQIPPGVVSQIPPPARQDKGLLV